MTTTATHTTPTPAASGTLTPAQVAWRADVRTGVAVVADELDGGRCELDAVPTVVVARGHLG